jgi:hypothetical protein
MLNNLLTRPQGRDYAKHRIQDCRAVERTMRISAHEFGDRIAPVGLSVPQQRNLAACPGGSLARYRQ